MDRQVSLRRGWAVIAATLLALFAAGFAGAREETPLSWEGMKRVNRPGLDAVYLRDGVSLAKYKKVVLDPVEVSFDKSWDLNRTRTGTNIAGSQKVDADKIRSDLAELARKVTKRELERKGGFPLVEEVGPDVLRVTAQIVDLYINAPDTMTPGSKSYVISAGEMTLVADLYDSQSGTLIGHVIDRKRGLEQGPFELQIANSVTNTAEADHILSMWARRLRSALENAR
jgi:hypothetical protein